MNATITRALPLSAIARDYLLVVERDNGDEPYDSQPRGCRCDDPIRNPEFDVESCLRCGAVLRYLRNGRSR